MRIKQLEDARFMKYISVVLILLFIVVLMLFTSGSSKPFDEVEKKVEASLDTENLVKQDQAALKRNFGLNAADYSGVMYYSSEFSISAEEVLLVQVKNDSQVQEVVNAMEDRIQTRKNDFEGYAPEQVKLLEDAQQSVRGKYIFFAVSSKADKYMDVFRDSL